MAKLNSVLRNKTGSSNISVRAVTRTIELYRGVVFFFFVFFFCLFFFFVFVFFWGWGCGYVSSMIKGGLTLGYSPLNMHEHSPRLFRGEYSLYIRAKLTSAVNRHDSYIGFCCVY